MPAVLITGAAAGIGRAAAGQFARDGWRCVLVDRDGAALATTVAGLSAPEAGRHEAVEADLTDAAAIDLLTARIGPLDALVNNAGMSDRANRPVVEQDGDDWQTLLALNLDAPARLVDALTPRLVVGARVVNVASGAGLRAIPWRGAYSASKAGLIGLSQALARERPDLRVSVLCPGFVRTELVDRLIASGRLDPARVTAKIPLGRMAEPEELAEAIRFLAGANGAVPSGLLLPVDGGSSVFGGSQGFAAAAFEPAPSDTPLRLQVVGDVAGKWSAVGQHGDGYAAVLDVSPLAVPGGKRLAAVHEAARRFAREHANQASLTLVLPADAGQDWRHAGDLAAARMLVATLACEWGALALRVNALSVSRDDPEAVAPLLRFMAGAGAQYLTGQVLPVA
ncbi:SDR family NAD(P)-dependent oxidoreductase [Cupriavidus sp. D39]|uniref:SDR family NAD(P)-dependent oxidoreductase n=1 Tax=Cupriavidus sp. D39 TaxID=2997877 RepID=UPI00226EFAF9|nr:SDR family oxidoreductase [Cupriavidus sp. D39]MCY0854112.1 SDR family oxidoreductase [Cupriavidus sp. D39]